MWQYTVAAFAFDCNIPNLMRENGSQIQQTGKTDNKKRKNERAEHQRSEAAMTGPPRHPMLPNYVV